MAVESVRTAAAYGPGYRGVSAPGEGVRRWLVNTPLLEHDHPKIRLQAARLTQLKLGERDKAVACFHFVRSLDFRCAYDPGHVTARQVLGEGAGDSHTKATLMVSLLRALGIPARVRFVSLTPALLSGLVNAETGIGHAFTEVHLAGEWLGLDAYVVDRELQLAACARLVREGRCCGYTVHLGGAADWDGAQSAFGHFNARDPGSLPQRDFGTFDEVRRFQQPIGNGGSQRWCYPALGAWRTVLINRRIKSLRCSTSIAA